MSVHPQQVYNQPLINYLETKPAAEIYIPGAYTESMGLWAMEQGSSETQNECTA